MICKLCLQDKKLQKKSHIIPNFMYKGMFGQNNKLVNISLENLGEKSIIYSGMYDKEILCSECDRELISGLESYASRCIYRHSKSNHGEVRVEKLASSDPEMIPGLRFHNLDYAKTKLFLLSILWRAHISKHPFFDQVQLGPHAEKLRKMILTNDPGLENQFEVVLIIINSDGTRPDKSVVSPIRITDDGNTYYVFHINQIMYHFNISGHNKMPLFEKGIIKKDGIMDIAVISDSIARGYFDSFMGRPLLMKSKIMR